MPTPLTIDTETAAELIGVAPKTLRSWRSAARGPRFIREGRIVRYREQDIERWLESRVVGTLEDPVKRRR
ncbi:helix-turn-helix domain-containing protein [Brachybacterium sp. JHP9]|uniref:Helix-turn-helix domain-containing protein n=1 Tax=Brachybacterium equifaecis TaxID=2910770 RepID=A0ABT0R352_9MICO|nr:helix-turn-helix domain-containing protein [Brachybacterium equifaecis]MCL6424352.1 helix-turn-helix domain-containing protein [Brachybacterium equifaecis]